jgi:hypothetical protein
MMTLLTGTLLAHGCRTVTAALRLSGEATNDHWSSFHDEDTSKSLRARASACDTSSKRGRSDHPQEHHFT